MTNVLSLATLDPVFRAFAQRCANDHKTAQKISKEAKETFRSFSVGNAVPVPDMVNAIVEGMHADVTRKGTSSRRRFDADPLLALWKIVRDLDTAETPRVTLVNRPPVIKEVEKIIHVAVEDPETAALLRFARSIMTDAQLLQVAAFGNGYATGRQDATTS